MPSAPLTPLESQFWLGWPYILLNHHMDYQNLWFKAPSAIHKFVLQLSEVRHRKLSVGVFGNSDTFSPKWKSKIDKPKVMSKLKSQEWQVESEKLTLLCKKLHVKSNMSKSQEQQVKSDLSRVASQEGHFKSDKSRMISQEWQVKSDNPRVACCNWLVLTS